MTSLRTRIVLATGLIGALTFAGLSLRELARETAGAGPAATREPTGRASASAAAPTLARGGDLAAPAAGGPLPDGYVSARSVASPPDDPWPVAAPVVRPPAPTGELLRHNPGGVTGTRGMRTLP